MPEHDSPAQLSRGDWRVVFSRTVHEYRIHQVQDIAAALTFYALLASLPAMLATLAAIGIFGRAETAAENVLKVIEDVGDASVADALRDPLDQLVNAANAELAFALGLVATLWAASGYVGAFGRGMNRVYGVKEGRPFWEVRPAMLAVSAAVVVLATIAGVLTIVTGPVAEGVARAAGFDEGVVFWWDLAKLPVLAAIGIAVLALLYWAAPNVKRRHLRWFSVGAFVALVAWLATTTLFGAYVLGFGTYERTYGVLGGLIALLLWIWLSNLAMLFGAVLDTEVERARQLHAGIDAAEQVQLPLRDDRRIIANRTRRARDVQASQRMRGDAVLDGVTPPAGRPPHG